MSKETNVIRISQELYSEIKDLSEGTDMSISELASKLIRRGLEGVKVSEETIVRKKLIFEDGPCTKK